MDTKNYRITVADFARGHEHKCSITTETRHPEQAEALFRQAAHDAIVRNPRLSVSLFVWDNGWFVIKGVSGPEA